MQMNNTKHTIEEKLRMGMRIQNDDGFTYSYGKGKFNETKGFMTYVKRSKRADKRGWKFIHMKRILEEWVW